MTTIFSRKPAEEKQYHVDCCEYIQSVETRRGQPPPSKNEAETSNEVFPTSFTETSEIQNLCNCKKTLIVTETVFDIGITWEK